MSGHDWHPKEDWLRRNQMSDDDVLLYGMTERVGKLTERVGIHPDPVLGTTVRFDTKDTNPKDTAGSARIDLSLLSPFALAEEALAMEEGGTKYGYYNYTVVGVKSRVYVSALMRHVFKWLLGEERDPKTGVHHLGSARACLGILIDAQVRGKLHDDRPPSHKEASSWLDGMEARVKRVREVFKGFSPRHYTIKDTQHEQGTGEQIHR